jgi:activator of 2-hydroxyglutaryl-CoA dehydratase/benzoyl-CoA reductase/2-hydroxyglutaryl-CoA dehydratase subunit BcrC/BadD/HgdB
MVNSETFTSNYNVQEEKELTYDKFRKFCKDTNREGKTLASSTAIRFMATKSLAARRTFLLREAFRPGNKVFATSLMVPPEIAWATGYVPLNLEMFSSLLASHSGILSLADKGSLTTPRCSFLNALIGAQKEGIVPKPDMVVSSTAYCEGVGYILEEVARLFGEKHEHIDLPQYLSTITIDAVAESLEDIFEKACFKQGILKKDGVENLRKVMYNSYLAHQKYLEIWELRKQYKPLNLGLEPLHWHGQFLPMWGDEKLPEILDRLKNEILEYINSGVDIHKGLPIAIYSLIPYGRTEVWEKLLDYDAFTTFEGVNYIGNYQIPDLKHFETMSVNELFFNMALNLVNTPMRGGDVARKTEGLLREMHELGSKGMILFSQEHCQMLVPRIPEAENIAGRFNIKTVSLGGDCILGMPKGPTSLRLETFLSNLGEKKEIPKADLSHPVKSISHKNGLRLGVDFGNGFSKFMILDNNFDILKQGLFNSGIDYPSILKLIKSYIPEGHDFSLAVSGVGSENPGFKEIATVQTTEINALIKATKQLFAGKKDFIVIDIGTQDVKVLKFDDDESGVWVNTNKSCGAGTGMVLVQILDRWQHSMPEMTFDKLDEMAFLAEKGELVNTTCGIFAVTNVVSALIQADDFKRCEIIRGVYEYIAAQAIRLLPPEDRMSKEIFLTGGLARHRTLRKIFRERGFTLLEIPSKLHSQFLVAYGTALSI